MPFFKFESFGFIISLGITLLLCGLIMFYVRQRFAAYDRHLIEQSQLLKHLVSNIQTNIGPSSELASSSAIKAAQLIHNRKNVDENNEKIVVSDDEIDSDSESENESESDSETSVSDSDSEDENKNNKCEALGKCPILPFGNMLTTLMSANKSSNKKNMSEKDSNEDTNEDSDEESTDSSRDSLSIESLSDDQITKEKIKHIDFTPKLDNIKVLENDDFDSALNVHNLDEEISNKNNVLDEIHVTKLNDVIEKSDNLETKKTTIFNLKDLSKKALQDICKDRNLPINGTKGELINRLSQ
jgi:hypothetical protein